ncbi:putative mitochondria-associated granulocyte macrophage CSF signaling molecule [Toxoplasma gondii TgCatPRC2]|uniref:Mitochondria-associated granulocyte macrophage CSF signaling molecule, putative n=16 Tax=Toxoplasma gondii TaxID=5811 RepID=B9PRA9_TOXGV|nr:mitochondria-associated granulocyte macrophage CSF signaling molecule, putative [Toxoplasma gondii ME49]EPR63399.1 putative mitochondria-associated granulocyte macrophage CSF signaling molecule [Toxoplasma gondii GT1]ESS34467.1 putative mitochondria-associated granulocyte macrophage CSF signaling molecule [Toxoplasma gondii VEG]KAF4638757.1 putative mitochondria-associated granulocyte macrophage CSF signaling molecule [Toxoplasma gondii]KFG40570.1 putative mitochondria-associated granulocyte|eukprot:XP_002367323.1 mitochondria-associated granulocyte macrophage CSF signaling molecule, putative [Toxoplasma gondii ME49]
MAIGPLGRILAQFVVVAGSAVGRAVVQAYRDAAKRGAFNATGAAGRQSLTLRSRMSADEARRILGLDSSGSSSAPLCRQDIEARHKRLYEINAPSGTFAGSPYLQKKVNIAKVILLEKLEEDQRATTKDKNKDPQK